MMQREEIKMALEHYTRKNDEKADQAVPENSLRCTQRQFDNDKIPRSLYEMAESYTTVHVWFLLLEFIAS